MSKFDLYYRKLVLSQFFTKGWGDFYTLNKIVDCRREFVSKREACWKLIPNEYKVHIDQEYKMKDHVILSGHFETPLVNHMADLIPPEVQSAKFQLLIPNNWSKNNSFNDKNLKPICFHLAGTGDHHFWRRRILLAQPLLSEYSIGSLILENPFYGLRRPKEQVRSSLRFVSDLFVMGANLVTECALLMKWCESLGYGPFILSGISMGGHMASLACTVWPKPVALVPCLSWTTASTVFTRGVMSQGIPWQLLEKQFNEDKNYRVLKERLEEINKFPGDGINDSLLTSFNEKAKVKKEIVDFMKLLMEECTHLINYDKPVDNTLVRVLTAKDDAYVLRDGVHDFEQIWPGCQVEYLDQGHVSAFIFSQKKFRQTIKAMLDLLSDKYY